jgi:hypothetical protein
MTEMPTLYHFTTRLYLPSILRQGINKGDVATEPDRGFNAPWLTVDPSFHNQPWDMGSFLDKTEVRLTVEVPEGDENLWSWAHLVEKYNIEPFWEAAMTQRGMKANSWFARLGGVPLMWITEVTERKGLAPFDLEAFIEQMPASVGRLEHHGEPGVVGEAEWFNSTKAEFLASLGKPVIPWAPDTGKWGYGKSSA